MKTLFTAFTCLFLQAFCYAQTFTDSSSELPSATNSGGCVAVTDMNGDGFDDICTLDAGNEITIFYQNLDGTPGFIMKTFGNISDENQWGMAIADINNDGHKDVFAGGNYDLVHYCLISDPDNYELFELETSMFMQGANLADINNDGWLDAFGCHDDAMSNIWANDGTGTLVLEDNWIDMASTPASDNSGNYGSVWSDFDNDNDVDLFIAKCRQFVQNPTDPRRINTAWINDGSSNYADEALDRGLVLYEQSWTVDFADIDNDGDFDCLLTNHSTSMKILENDGKGYFTDITSGSGLEVNGFFLQAKMADFDNDGYLDLLTSGGDGGSNGFYRNNGNNTFTDLDLFNTLPASDILHSFGIGDLNKDGHLDIFASYGDTYVNPDFGNDDRLWINDGNANNFIGYDLSGVASNMDAVGAKIQIYGDFGTQVREVRSGESYGITNSNIVHFGLGTFTMVDYAVIKWPSGAVTVLENQMAGEYYNVTESDCAAPTVIISADDMELCDGEVATITADQTGTILWSNGMIGNDIQVTGGNISAVVLTGGCAGLSNTLCIAELDEVDPTLNVLGDLELCDGESVMLEAPDAVAYVWNTDETTQVIEVTEAGSYSVTISGGCSDDVVSNTVSVTVLGSPDSAPVVSDVEESAGLVEVSASGDDIAWFSDAAGNNLIGSGSPFSLDVQSNTTIYAANQIVYGDPETANGGKEDISNPGQYHDNSSNGLVFTANEDMVIRNVKVFANGAGNREIVVYDSNSAIIQSGTFSIPDGESVVNLNFEIPAGTDYVINTTDNNPQLWRDAAESGVSYPYELGALGAITGTTINGQNEFNYYYFFYDWNVETPSTSCYSDLVALNIIIVGVEEIESLSSFSIFPNPTSAEIHFEYTAIKSGTMFVSLTDSQGKLVYDKMFNTNIGSHQGIINVSDCAPGVYTFNILEEGNLTTKQVIIE